MLARKLFLSAALIPVMAAITARAQDHHGGREAHVHGAAELLVVLEDAQLDIELRSPAMNLLGFESRARSPGQRARVESARASLANAAGLFQFDRGQCRLLEHTADFSSVVEEGAPRGGGHAQEQEHHHAHQNAHGHSDIEAHYSYRCEQPGRLETMSTAIPTLFPGIEALQVQWILGGRQGMTTLDNSDDHVIFR